jgi:hypothetical protein
MEAVATSYHELGRYQDALALRKILLEFHQRVLPEDHPDIGAASVSFVDLARGLIHFVSGDAMIKLAQTYSSMERHHDALALKERVLEFNRRVLPKDHPSIGAAKC